MDRTCDDLIDRTGNDSGSEGETFNLSTMSKNYNIHLSRVMSKAKTKDWMLDAYRIER